MLLSTLADYLLATGAEGARIVVTVKGTEVELDLTQLRNESRAGSEERSTDAGAPSA